jgi:hypothetical protein
MKKKLTYVILGLFILSIIFFSGFGKAIRDYYSPHVTVMSPVYYTFADGTIVGAALVNSCFYEVDSETMAYIIEERTDTGERAYHAKMIRVILGRSDEKCTEVKKSEKYEAMYICESDRNFLDGDRVVIEKIINAP